jgi:hypothetical protein
MTFSQSFRHFVKESLEASRKESHKQDCWFVSGIGPSMGQFTRSKNTATLSKFCPLAVDFKNECSSRDVKPFVLSMVTV